MTTTDDEQGKAKPSIEDIWFEGNRWRALRNRRSESKRVWQTKNGDEVGLFFTNLPPDLPRANTVFKNYRQYFQGFLEGSKGTMIDCSISDICGCPSIITAYSIPQVPFGKAYVGTINIPFAEFSYVIKCHCEGRGAGGLKEAILLGRGVPAANYDEKQYDVEFPDHPISRVRSILGQLVATIRMSDEVLRRPRFALRLESS